MELCRTEEEETLRSFCFVLSSDQKKKHNSWKKKKYFTTSAQVYPDLSFK